MHSPPTYSRATTLTRTNNPHIQARGIAHACKLARAHCSKPKLFTPCQLRGNPSSTRMHARSTTWNSQQFVLRSPLALEWQDHQNRGKGERRKGGCWQVVVERMETSLETELEMATNDDCLACVLLRRRLLALPSATPHCSLHLCCCPLPCSLATCRPRASPDGPLALTGNAPRPYGSQMHALVPRAGLAGKRASAARDLTDADCPQQPVADRQPRAVVYQ